MGFIPSVPLAFLMLLFTMIVWGSWTSTHKKCGNWRFEGFYWDYAWSIVVASFAVSFVLGGVTPTGWSPTQFIQSMFQTSPQAIVLALCAGIVGGFGNMLLVAAIVLAGMSVAFPLGIGLALVVGTSLAYVTNPTATKHPEFLFFGLFIVLLAVIANALAYRSKEKVNVSKNNLRRGVTLSILCGVLIGLYAFPFNYAFKLGMTGYTGAVFMTIGIAIATAVLLPVFMRNPILPGQKAVGFTEYTRAKRSWHLWAIFGGSMWAIATVFNMVVSSMPTFSVAIAFTLGNCSPMIAALWGVFVWREFKNAPRESYLYLVLMFGLFIAGIIILANAAG